MIKLLQRHAFLLTTFCVTAASSLPWLSVITGPRAWVSLVLATSVGTWLGYMATSRKKRSFLFSPGGNILVLLAVLIFVSLDAPWNLGDLLQGFLNGFSRLSTTVLPATSTNGLLVSPIAVVAVVAWMVGRFEGARAGSLKNLLPWLANFLGATAFGATYNGATRTLGIVLAVCLLAWLVLKSQRSRTYVERDPDETAVARVYATFGPILLMSLLTTGLIYGQSQLPVVDGSAVGLHRQAPNMYLNGANPSIVLATLRYSKSSTEPLFDIRSTQRLPAVNGTRYALLPIATLSKYDGRTWAVESLQPVNEGATQLVAHDNGWKRPAKLPAATIKVTVRAAADNMNLNRYIPTPGGFLVYVAGTDVAADSVSGFGVSEEPLSEGMSISVTGTSNMFGPPKVSEFKQSPRACQVLMGALGLTQIGTGCDFKPFLGTPLELVTKLSNSFHDNGGLTPLSNPEATNTTGQSLADLESTVRGSQHMGTSEQYATYVALAARLVGLPSRIVTGFRIPSDTTAASLTAANSYTWTEVYDKGRWHVLYATPTREGKGSARSGALTVQPPAPDPSGSSSCAQTSCNTVIHPYAPRGTGNRWLQLLVKVAEVAGGLVLLLIVWSGTVSLLKHRRRRARRRGSAPQQVRGAVAELLALRRELGRSPRLRSASATELVQSVRQEIADSDDEAGDAIVDQVNIAYYSITPESDLPVQDVWEWVDRATKKYRKLSSHRSKMRARLYYTRQLS